MNFDREPLNATYDREYILQKAIKNTICTGCNNYSLNSRTVLLEHHHEKGRCVFIRSKDKSSQKDKNVIPLFCTNPASLQNIEINGKEQLCVLINRNGEKPIILTSDTELLTRMFYDDIEGWINSTNDYRKKFQQWSECLQNQLYKCVHSLQNKKILVDQLQIKDKAYAINSLRYLSFVLNSNSNGYHALKDYSFNKWKEHWDQSNLAVHIKNRHSLIKDNLGLFKDLRENTNVNIRNSTVDEIYDKLSGINKNFTSIISNLQRYNSYESMLNEDTKIEIVQNLQKLADLRHHIQSITKNEEEFILIGDQSSGKSSLLCMLLGVNIAYTDSVFATRCPVRYVLEPCDPKAGWKYQYEDPKSKAYMQCTQEELQKKMLMHFKATIGKNISFEPFNIKISSPICTSPMTLVDLPGLVGMSDDTHKNEQHLNSYSLVQQYINKPNVFILFVHRFDVDIGCLNTKILDIVKQKQKNNVIYCITHFDRFCNDKDITYENIMDTIKECSAEVADGKNMFLLSLSKKVSDLPEKEESVRETVNYLTTNHARIFKEKNISFNLDSVKNFLRKKMHRHVLEINTVLSDFLSKQKYIIASGFNTAENNLYSAKISEIVLDVFLSQFKHKIQKLLKGHLIPLANSDEKRYFETLSEEINNANTFSINQDVDIWPTKNIVTGENTDYQITIDPSLKRDLVSHALLTRTIYELKMRLCSINIEPSMDDIVHGITYDPDINLDTPKDSTHCVMLYTIKRQLDINGFFEYSIKRLQYIFYKIIKYVIWSIINAPETPEECVFLLQKKEFQEVFEIEMYNYINKLSSATKTQFNSHFNEIINSPIIISHSKRYKDMLINDFGWTEEEIDSCNDGDIFRSKNIGAFNKDNIDLFLKADEERLAKIKNLIKLHIHVRILMMCEYMSMNIDYNWRRMLDDTREIMTCDKDINTFNIFDYIKQHICKTITVNNRTYSSEHLHRIYNGVSNEKSYIDPNKIAGINSYIDNLSEYNEKIPDILHQSVKLAGNKFL